MKKLALAACLLLTFMPAPQATVNCTVPFNLTNGTTADATQVMANYNAILSCLSTSAASSGANSDITSLTGLTTPLAPGLGGTNNWTGATSTGSANAQVVTTSPTSFTKGIGNSVTFVPGFSNTGPLQLNVNGTGLTNAFRKLPTGIAAMAGGEVLAGSTTRFIYDGTQFVQDVSSSSLIPVGVSFDFMGTSVPVGFLIMDGSCVSTTTYAGLFAYLGAIWGAGCAGGQFKIPDLRGRTAFGYDSQGTQGAANRLTTGTGTGNCAATTVGVACGAQSGTIAQGNLPNVNFTIPAGQGAHFHSYSQAFNNTGAGYAGGSVFVDYQTNNTGTATLPAMFASSGGSGIAVANLPPMVTAIKAIKY